LNNLVADSESLVRLIVFVFVLIVLAILESLFPRRQLDYPKSHRWFTNFGISLFNTALVRVTLPLAGVGAALLASDQGWGLFNLLSVSPWFSVLIFLLAFDLTIYFQHRLFHAIPILWRLHRMHHTDVDYDVSTGNRFHPLSILLSSLIKMTLILLLGPLPAAVLIAELLLNVTSMFNHSNLKIGVGLDKTLRNFIVTPDMHRVHHSVDASEHNRNFGFNFPWWDRLFGTYQNQPELDHDKMEIGITGFRDQHSIELHRLFTQPLKK
jgi:sterol desaturase/sphingolipid hydroxylase (fatty acid hydroxylase superfamily)